MSVFSPLSRRLFVAGFAATLALGSRPAGATADAVLLADLRAGGLTFYLRHGTTNRGGEDGPLMPREEQRLLSPAGEAQAERIGQRFRTLGIPTGEVLTSPMHRCIDMARIAFGGATIEPMLLNSANGGRPLGRTRWLREQLARPIAAGTNRVLVGHSPNLTRAAGVSIAEGETAIFRADGAGGYVLLGTVRAEAW